LIDDIQLVESNVVSEKKLVQEAFRNLTSFVKSNDGVTEQFEKDLFASEMQLRECREQLARDEEDLRSGNVTLCHQL
jgi:hypothetical protein